MESYSSCVDIIARGMAANGGGGTTNYNNLSNKPQINGVTLQGNKTTQDLHIMSSGAEVFDDYETAVTAINAWAADHRGLGDNVYIRAQDVPDLWVSGVEDTSVPYTYTTDAAIVSALKTDGYVQFGYYKLSALETQKVEVPDVQINGTSIVQDGVANITSENIGAVLKPEIAFSCLMASDETKTLTINGTLV